MAKRTKRLTSQGIVSEEIRINKFLSEAGVCSRREADRYIEEGKVLIDGVKAEMGSKVGKESLVTFMGKPVKKEEKLVLIAFNKPEGIVCTTDSREPDNIIDFIGYGMRIYPIGRLDKDSEGLILLTNDGNIVNKILRAENHHEKEYIVTVNKELTPDFIRGMSQGVPILDTVTKSCEVTAVDRFTFRIILTQGLNRQIRRMCEYFGYHVTNLTRIRIMNINLGRLKTGDWRNVTEKEIEEMNRLIQTGSQKEGPKDKGSHTAPIQTKSKADGRDKLQTKPKSGSRDRVPSKPKDDSRDRVQTKPKSGSRDRAPSKLKYESRDRLQSNSKTGGIDRVQTKSKAVSTAKAQTYHKGVSSNRVQVKAMADSTDSLQIEPTGYSRDKFHPISTEGVTHRELGGSKENRRENLDPKRKENTKHRSGPRPKGHVVDKYDPKRKENAKPWSKQPAPRNKRPGNF